jgi:N-sulfoglucosamine sulfohydrolase
MANKITRRKFLRYSALGTLGATFSVPVGCSWSLQQRQRHERPNIVMYLSDDHGIDFLGCYGNKDVKTPNIDALAKEGMLFTNMFAASPTCAPSRSVLWTGLYPAHNGCMRNHSSCRADITALPTYLRQLGYRVVLAHKFHAKPRKEVFSFEFIEAKLPRNPANRRTYRREGLNTKDIDQFLAEHTEAQPDTPLCLILADSSPHVTWEPNKIYDSAKLRLPPFIVDTPLTRKAMANYYQDITTMDKRVGQVRTMLRKYAFEHNTLFIYTSDQGSEWPHSKWTLYDAGIHVPFIAVWPGRIKPGSVCDAMISFVDMTPTFVDMAGGQQPDGLDGKSFRSVLLGRSKTLRDCIYASHTADGKMNIFPQRGVRDARYKYILNLNPERTWTTHFTKVPDIPESHKEVWDTWVEKAKTDAAAAKIVGINEKHPREELYDTQANPYELNNIADQPEMRPILLKMRERLKKWLASQGETMPARLP